MNTLGYRPVKVLSHDSENNAARLWLRKRGWDVTKHQVQRLRYLVLNHHLLRIDGRKSWDVAYFADLLDRSTDRTAGVADVGSVGSELPWILHLAGFQRIIGCDLDSCVTRMPFGRFIDYRHGDFAEVVTEVDLGAVTAVSTIE